MMVYISSAHEVFINNSCDLDKLRDYFSQYGSVEDAVVMKDPVTKRSRGFGFITFSKAADVEHVLSFDTHLIDSRKVF